MPEETVLIQALPVNRDADGWWSHPDYLSEFDDEITEAQFNDWCARHQVETKITYMESDVEPEIFDTYMSDGQVNCSAWRSSIRQSRDGSFSRFMTLKMGRSASGVGR